MSPGGSFVFLSLEKTFTFPYRVVVSWFEDLREREYTTKSVHPPGSKLNRTEYPELERIPQGINSVAHQLLVAWLDLMHI